MAEALPAPAEPATRPPVSSIERSAPSVEASSTVFDARTERQRQVMATLEAGVAQLLHHPASYFRVMARFHTYSFNNSLLIMQQFPDATKVASYDDWKKKYERQVVKGATGIKIFFPYKRWETDEETGEQRPVITGFGIGNVFDVSQTDGKPLPPTPTLATALGESEAAKDVDRRLSGWLLDEGQRLMKLPLGAARGIWSPGNRVVALNLDLPFGDVLTTKTLMHEAAHYAGDHRGIAREDAETVAEAAAFVAMSHFGMPTDGYSFGYVASWAKDTDVLKRNLGEVQKVTNVLIGAVEGQPSQNGASDLS